MAVWPNWAARWMQAEPWEKISVDFGSLSSKTYFVTVIILGQEFRICDLTNQV